MAKTKANYSILVGVELQTKQIQQELDKVSKNLKGLDLKVSDKAAQVVKQIGDNTDKAKDSANDLSLEWQQAQTIMSKSLEIITAMVDEVYDLDSAMTEFRKVSDLEGTGLESYVRDLTDLGKTVARTGRPLCLSRNVQMVNVHLELSENQ